MIHLNAIELFGQPRKELYEKLHRGIWEEPQMREDESAFLCGLLRQEKPQDILEVGVYSGTTTAIMAQCMKDIGTSCRIHSVDLARNCDGNDPARPVGYVFSPLKDGFAAAGITHSLQTGQVAPAFLEETDRKYDFLMLDTVHTMPGELLDFLSILPHLKDGAMVCVHDISLLQMHLYRERDVACCALISSVAGDKYLNSRTVSSPFETKYPNIGAFRVTPETRTHIENVFMSLCLRWSYFPSAAQLCLFRKCFRKHYAPELVRIFEEALEMNCDNSLLIDLEALPIGSRVLLYGSGVVAETIRRKILRTGMCELLGWVSPDWRDLEDPLIGDPDTADYSTADYIILAFSRYRDFQAARDMLVRERNIEISKIYINYVPFDYSE